MAANRQERLLMRQRGAGTRQIKDVEFQLVLPGQPVLNVPLKPQLSESSGRTPQPDLLPRRSSRRTPQPTQLLPRYSTKHTPATVRKRKAGKPPPSDLTSSEDRKDVLGTLSTHSDAEGSTTKKRKTSIQRAGQASYSAGLGQTADGRPATILEQHEDLPQPNAQTAPSKVPVKKRKKRKSIGQNSRKKPKLPKVEKGQESGNQPMNEAQESVSHQLEILPSPQGHEINDKSSSSAGVVAIESEGPLQDLAPDLGAQNEAQSSILTSKSPAERKAKRKKRKSIGQQRPRRKATGEKKIREAVQSAQSDAAGPQSEDQNGNLTITKPRGRGRPKKILPAFAIKHIRSEALPDIDSGSVGLNTKPSQGRGRPRKELSNLDAGNQEDGNEISPIKDLETAEVIPNRKRGRRKSQFPSKISKPSATVGLGKIQRRKAAPDTTKQKISTTSRKPPKNSMPITVYRMSSTHTVDHNEDPNAPVDPSTFPKRNGVNAVDVLSQFCRELVLKSSDSLKHAARKEPDKPEKAALERKRKTIELYGNELDNRLCELTKTLDTNIALSTRVRRANKEEKALRLELKTIQREREEMAQRKSKIKEAREKAEARRKLTSLLHELEAAVRHGRELDLERLGPEPGSGVEVRGVRNLDVLLKRVAMDVGSVEGGEDGLVDGAKGSRVLERGVEAI